MFKTEGDMITECSTVALRWRQVAILKLEESACRQPAEKKVQWHGMSFYKIKDDRMVEGRIVDYEESIQN